MSRSKILKAWKQGKISVKVARCYSHPPVCTLKLLKFFAPRKFFRAKIFLGLQYFSWFKTIRVNLCHKNKFYVLKSPMPRWAPSWLEKSDKRRCAENVRKFKSAEYPPLGSLPSRNAFKENLEIIFPSNVHILSNQIINSPSARKW